MIVVAYLAAIVAANLVVAALGPSSVVLVALVAIGFDLVARDRLHDAWRGRGLVPRMAVLVAAGGVLSYLANGAAGPIAVASTVSFAAASIVDGIVYALLARSSFLVRSNGSNLVAAAVDSVLFPTIAFGAFLPLVVLGQFAAKVVGGFAWSLVLRRRPLRARDIILADTFGFAPDDRVRVE